MARKSFLDELSDTRDLLNSISPSFCLAKWLQHTLYLQNGMNHSCHHPPTHKIPMEEIEHNPKALHNTQYKKKQMEKMLNGERPKECDYCWRVEDMGDKYFSDRIYKSNVSWSQPYIYDVINTGLNDIEPSYLEISFSNVCNLKCAYCSPDLSSRWYDEIKQHGHYPTHFKHNNFDAQREMGRMPIPHKDHNPYVDAFWKWWPELYPSLHTLRLTGGEPLMSKDCWRVLEAIAENPIPDLTLAINTNLDVEDHMIDRFIDLMLKIGPNVRELQIFTSGEATDEAAEYTRFGLDYENWYNNCNKVLDALFGKFKLTFAFMTTVNIFSVGTFDKFFKDVLALRAKYIEHRDDGNILPCMSNYLRYPNFLAISNLDDTTKAEFEKKLRDLCEEYKVGIIDGPGVLWEDEINQIERLIEFMNTTDLGAIEMNRTDFVKFVDEYDRRRGTMFRETFPYLTDYYDMCKGIA